MLSQSLRERVTVVIDPKVDSAYPAAFGGEVILSLRSGEVLKLCKQNAKGDPEASLSRQEMIDKADFLMRHGGTRETSEYIDAILATAEGGAVPKLPFCR